MADVLRDAVPLMWLVARDVAAGKRLVMIANGNTTEIHVLCLEYLPAEPDLTATAGGEILVTRESGDCR